MESPGLVAALASTSDIPPTRRDRPSRAWPRPYEDAVLLVVHLAERAFARDVDLKGPVRSRIAAALAELGRVDPAAIDVEHAEARMVEAAAHLTRSSGLRTAASRWSAIVVDLWGQFFQLAVDRDWGHMTGLQGPPNVADLLLRIGPAVQVEADASKFLARRRTRATARSRSGTRTDRRRPKR